MWICLAWKDVSEDMLMEVLWWLKPVRITKAGGLWNQPGIVLLQSVKQVGGDEYVIEKNNSHYIPTTIVVIYI